MTGGPDMEIDIVGEGDPNAIGTGALPFRRLSHREYDNSIQAIFAESGAAIPPSMLIPDAIPGYDNEATALGLSETLADQYVRSGRQVAQAVAATLVSECTPGDDASCIAGIFDRYAPRILRHRPSDSTRARYLAESYLEGAALSVEARVQLLLTALLNSPHFLYKIEVGEEDEEGIRHVSAEELASRLSFFLWGESPDDGLLDAAWDGRLDDEEGIAGVVREMIEDERFEQGADAFHRQWLLADKVLKITDSQRSGDEWNENLRAQIAEEPERMAWGVLQSGASVGELFTTRLSELTPELAAFYGVSGAGDGWTQRELPAQRSGILTTAAFLAGSSHSDTPSPIFRGVFVLDQFLCFRPPPPSVDIDAAEAGVDAEGLSNREFYEAVTAPSECGACHGSINGIGFSFEHFDGAGRYRSEDAGRPVDATGTLQVKDIDAAFDDVRGLGVAMAGSEAVQECVVEHWLRFAHARGEADVDARSQIARAWREGGAILRELPFLVATDPSFRRIAEEAL